MFLLRAGRVFGMFAFVRLKLRASACVFQQIAIQIEFELVALNVNATIRRPMMTMIMFVILFVINIISILFSFL